MITVPVNGQTTNEYYPSLTDFEVITQAPDGCIVNWTDAAGARHTDTAPEMHGGSGLTLAFRTFAAQDIQSRLIAAGFAKVIEPPPIPELGIPEIANSGIFLARKSQVAAASDPGSQVLRVEDLDL